MIRRLVVPSWCAMMAGLLVISALKAGPSVEDAILPVRSQQSISDVIRFSDRACWTWNNNKRRDKLGFNVDAFLSTVSDRYVVTLVDYDTLQPWAMSGRLPVGEHHQSWCVMLPSGVSPAEPIRITYTVQYAGFFGLWTLNETAPEIVSPPPPLYP